MEYIAFNSHEQQDEFIFNLFEGKRNGTFLDISCGNPKIGSNTYALEQFRGWQGYGFDLSNVEELYQWSSVRKSEFVLSDATSEELTEFLKNNITDVVDYVSLDVDASGTNLAYKALERVIDSGIKFKAMTFEHEHYQHGDAIREPSRQLLESRGYVRLFEDVKLWTGSEQPYYFEDWWIDPEYFDQRVLEAGAAGLYYFECVDRLRKVSGLNYKAQHNCSRAWVDEYCLFWNPGEEASIKMLPKRQS